MPDLCDRMGCTGAMSTDPERGDGQTFGFVRRVGWDTEVDRPIVRIYCSTECVDRDWLDVLRPGDDDE